MEGILDIINPRNCKLKYPKWLLMKKCCFCIPIRKGVAIFGYFNLVLCLLMFPLITFMLVKPKESITYYQLADLVITILRLVFSFILTVVLLIAIQKENKQLLKVYFFVDIVFLTFSFGVNFAYKTRFEDEIMDFLYYAVLGLFSVYKLLVVYSTICSMEEYAEVQYVEHKDPKSHNV